MNLAAAVLSLAPLESQLAHPITLPVSDDPAWPGVLTAAKLSTVTRMFEAAGLRRPAIGWQAREPSPLDKVAAAALAAATLEPLDLLDPAVAMLQSGQWIRPRGADGRMPPDQRWARSADGVRLSTFDAGASALPPVLVFGPPGMPLGILGGWLERIATGRRVATWETRGLFGPDIARPVSLGHETHAMDAMAVLEMLGWDDAHVIGFCGGAALALGFAASHPTRVRSLSLLFGDYELGALAPKSAHQTNLQALMGMVVGGRVSAAQLHAVLLQAVARMAEPDLAPFALYPYANPELLDRYCRINHAVMSADCGIHLPKIAAPVLVAYDQADDAVHPAGSRVVAARTGARLEVLSGCGHLGTFRGHKPHVDTVLAFLGACERDAVAAPSRRNLI
jgi:pimeloyl-ACP methyl ester carboxylesterase